METKIIYHAGNRLSWHPKSKKAYKNIYQPHGNYDYSVSHIGTLGVVVDIWDDAAPGMA